MFRIGLFYPNVTSDFDMADCPRFWQTRKIEINLLNMKDEEYMDNIQMTAFIAIGMDIVVGIGSIIFIWRTTNLITIWSKSKDEVGPWSLFGCNIGPFKLCRGFGKLNVFMNILFVFGMPLIDTTSGKTKLF